MKSTNRPGFLCGECGESFTSMFSLAEHGNMHTGNQPFACSVCFMTFQSVSLYVDHYEKNHNTNLKPTDEIRSQPHEPDASLNPILRKELPRRNKKCLRQTSHNQPSTPPILCSCLESFSSSEEFRKHLGPSPFRCCACDMAFLHINYIKKHIRSHTNEKPFACLQCNRAFSQRINLRNHMSIHAGENAVKCELCVFACKTRGGLFKHMQKHKLGLSVDDKRKVSTQDYVCENCGKKFKFQRNLAMHMKSHFKEERLCTGCGKLFPNGKKLNDHIKSNHGATYVCKICQKEFRGWPTFRNHERTHRTEKNHVCSLCKKAFALPQYLRCHMRTHGPRILHSCDRCGEHFTSLKALTVHQQSCGHHIVLATLALVE